MTSILAPAFARQEMSADEMQDFIASGARNVQTIDLGYRPRRLQAVLHRSLKRFNVLVCHRRFGKTVFAIMEMVDKGLRNELHRPQYAYIAPNYGQAKRVAWEYLKDFTRNIPGAKPNEADLRIDVPRPDRGDFVRFFLLGAENPGSIRGIYLDGAIIDEFAECDPTVWGEAVRPTLSDRKGWVIFIGTPKGKNHFFDIYDIAKNDPDRWFNAMYKASETGIIDEEELLSARAMMAEEEYMQEYECSFTAALIGSYYGAYINDLEAMKPPRICTVPYDPAVAVNTWWDLGIGDSTAIWFQQRVGPENHIIDYEEIAGKGLEFYARLLRGKDYIYGTHTIPHDGAARELGTGKTRQETLREYGIPTTIQPRQALADGIHACRTLLPTCWFDKVKCARGLDSLRNYQRLWNSKNKEFEDKPKHDWTSHGADAFRTMGLGLQNHRLVDRKDLPRMAVGEYNELRTSSYSPSDTSYPTRGNWYGVG